MQMPGEGGGSPVPWHLVGVSASSRFRSRGSNPLKGGLLSGESLFPSHRHGGPTASEMRAPARYELTTCSQAAGAVIITLIFREGAQGSETKPLAQGHTAQQAERGWGLGSPEPRSSGFSKTPLSPYCDAQE